MIISVIKWQKNVLRIPSFFFSNIIAQSYNVHIALQTFIYFQRFYWFILDEFYIPKRISMLFEFLLWSWKISNLQKTFQSQFSHNRSEQFSKQNTKYYLFSLYNWDWPSQPGTIHFLIGKFSFFVIRFLYYIFFLSLTFPIWLLDFYLIAQW